MLVATLGIMFFSMMDAVMKGQALAMGTYNAMFWRMTMGALIVAVLYLPTRPVPASGRVLKIHLIRAALTAVMAYLFFFGLTRVPLAQAIGLSFIAPIITLFLAVPLLGERIGANAKLAAVLGFGGVMIVVGGELLAVDAGSDLLGMTSILISAVMYAFNLILQRMQALVAKPLEIAFYQNTIVFMLLLIGVPFAVSWPASSLQWGGAMLAAAFAVGSLMLMSAAYRQAEAQRLVVFCRACYRTNPAGDWFDRAGLSGECAGRESLAQTTDLIRHGINIRRHSACCLAAIKSLWGT